MNSDRLQEIRSRVSRRLLDELQAMLSRDCRCDLKLVTAGRLRDFKRELTDRRSIYRQPKQAL
jgi:hypothetical protein